MMITRLRASPRHGGVRPVFWSFSRYQIRRGGVPSGAAAFVIIQDRDTNLHDMLDLIVNEMSLNPRESEILLSPACIPHIVAKFALK